MRATETHSPAVANAEKKMTQWTKWSMLRALAAAGHDAEAFRPLSTEFLRKKLLIRVSKREAQHYLNKTDTYILNLCAIKHASADRWISECDGQTAQHKGFAHLRETGE
ncbi:MAG: hypothetical protein IJB41_00170 [Clostridia bacterium]|nr:hypothetical protein [Clostridia bacterium]